MMNPISGRSTPLASVPPGTRSGRHATGRKLLILVVDRRPDLLILDVWMPKLNGFEVLERLRADPDSSNLKVVMLSNLGDSDTRLEGYSVGVADYWVKGLSLAELQERVGQILADIELTTDPG